MLLQVSGMSNTLETEVFQELHILQLFLKPYREIMRTLQKMLSTVGGTLRCYYNGLMAAAISNPFATSDNSAIQSRLQEHNSHSETKAPEVSQITA